MPIYFRYQSLRPKLLMSFSCIFRATDMIENALGHAKREPEHMRPTYREDLMCYVSFGGIEGFEHLP
jgi:hypothetical protein